MPRPRKTDFYLAYSIEYTIDAHDFPTETAWEYIDSQYPKFKRYEARWHRKGDHITITFDNVARLRAYELSELAGVFWAKHADKYAEYKDHLKLGHAWEIEKENTQ